MKVAAYKHTKTARVEFSRSEWYRIELYAERSGLSVTDIVEAVIKYGYKEFFSRASET